MLNLADKKLIAKESITSFLCMIISMTFLMTIVSGMLLPAIIVCFYYRDISDVVAACMLLGVTIMCAYFFYFSALRRRRLKIYEEGFAPFRVSLKYVFRSEEYFVPWEKVLWLESAWERGGMPPKQWGFFVVFKDERDKIKRHCVYHKQFKKEERHIVYSKLKEIEEHIQTARKQPPKEVPRVIDTG